MVTLNLWKGFSVAPRITPEIKAKIQAFRQNNQSRCSGLSDECVISIMLKEYPQTFSSDERAMLGQSLFLKKDGLGAMDGFEYNAGQDYKHLVQYSTSANAELGDLSLCADPSFDELACLQEQGAELIAQMSLEDRVKFEIANELRDEVVEAREQFDYQVNVKDDVFAKAADWISHFWSNPWSMIGNSSTVTEIRLDEAMSSVLELSENKFKGTPLEGLEFRRSFTKLTGQHYDHNKAKNYLQARDKYIAAAESEMILNELKKNCTLVYNVPKFSPRNDSFSFVQQDTTKPDQRPNNFKRYSLNRPIDSDSIDKTECNLPNELQIIKLQEFLGLDDEQIAQISCTCKEFGLDEFEYYQTMGEELIKSYEKEHKKILGGSTVDKYKSSYEFSHKLLYGDKIPIKEHVDDFCSSQDMGGSVVKGVAIVAISTATAGIAGTAVTATGLFTAQTAGAIGTGISTATASYAVDTLSKATNGIDNSKDLWTTDAQLKMGRSALVNGVFAALIFKGGTLSNGAKVNGTKLRKLYDSSSKNLIDKAKFGKHFFSGTTTKMASSSVLDGGVELGKQIMKGEKISMDKIFAKATASAIASFTGTFLGSNVNKFLKRAEADAHIAYMKQNKASIIKELLDMGENKIAKQLEDPAVFENYINHVVFIMNADEADLRKLNS